MNYEQAYRRLVSGEITGLTAAVLRMVLSVAAAVYSLIIRARNFMYSKAMLKSYKVKAAVISVGNITAGGTGKTPLVIWLCNQITENPRFSVPSSGCAILTRGYKTTKNLKLKTQNYFDEPVILAQSCPEVKVVVNPDRFAAAVEVVENSGAKVLIMDDGFQHRRLKRDLDIVTIDAMCPFGYGKILPAGLLREPIAELKRADVVVITRCDQVCEAELSQIEKKLRLTNPGIIIAKSMHKPICAKSIDNRQIGLEELRNKKIFAFCGIGNPDAFLGTIKGLGADTAGSKVYNDHHYYTENDIAEIHEKAKEFKADFILTTQKDWTKIITGFRSLIADYHDALFAYLVIELKFLAGQDKITRLLEETLSGKISKN